MVRNELRTLQVDEALRGVLRGDSVDWPETPDSDFYELFLKQARYHGVESLVCHLLRSDTVWETLPVDVKGALLNHLKVAVAHEMLRAKDLADLLKLLDLQQIPILILKGCAIAYTHYPEPYLRARCDTDILIRPGDIHNVREILVAAGYELSGQVYKSHQFNGYRAAFGHAVNYDVHWRPNNNAKYARVLSHEKVLQESIPVPGLDSAFCLSTVHALLLACMHRAGNPGHDPDKLIWLYDIHLLISAMSESELTDFARLAVAADIQPECRDGIVVAGECFRFNIPKAVLQLLSTPLGPGSIAKRFADSALGLITDDLKQLPDKFSRLALVREYLLPTGDYLLNRYRKQNVYWIPLLYFRYVLTGFFERVSLR